MFYENNFLRVCISPIIYIYTAPFGIGILRVVRSVYIYIRVLISASDEILLPKSFEPLNRIASSKSYPTLTLHQ